MYLSIIALVAALTVHSTALPQLKPLALDISKAVEKRQGPAGIIPEIIMVAIVDAGGPAVEAFGFGAQITAELFGDLDQNEPYKDTSNCRMEVLSVDGGCTMTTWGKGEKGSGHAYTPSVCAFGTPITYNDPIVGTYVLNFKTTTGCPNTNKCGPVVDFNSHWYPNGSHTGIELDFAADDDDHDSHGNGETFLCTAGEDGGYTYLCAVPCGQEQPNSLGYAPGQCGIHLTQHQKTNPNDPNLSDQAANYLLDITFKDANQNPIANVTGIELPANVPVSIADAPLPLPFTVTGLYQDSDPLLVSYGGDSWNTSQTSQCSMGQGKNEGYQGGYRQGDCGFTC